MRLGLLLGLLASVGTLPACYSEPSETTETTPDAGGDEGGGGGESDASLPDGEPEPQVDPCAASCEGVERDYETNIAWDEPRDSEEAQKWATCFSCRCKTALGVLPNPEDLECSDADGPLKRWRPTRNAAGRVTGVEEIDAHGTDTSECLNPGMAVAGCDLQSRFKRMLYNEGNTEFQLLCRKRTTQSDGYYEYLIIGHNQQNGATCFWQAQDNTFKGEEIPKLDLTRATPAEKSAYTNTFYLYSEGPSTCTGCHANDAFLLSPYLHSEWSISDARLDQAARRRIKPNTKYKLVTADQAVPQPVIRPDTDLTAEGQPLEEECGSCHRVTKGSYCGFAIGALNEDQGLDNLLPQDNLALFQFASPFLFWMPHGGAGSYENAVHLQEFVRDACNGE